MSLVVTCESENKQYLKVPMLLCFKGSSINSVLLWKPNSSVTFTHGGLLYLRDLWSGKQIFMSSVLQQKNPFPTPHSMPPPTPFNSQFSYSHTPVLQHKAYHESTTRIYCQEFFQVVLIEEAEFYSLKHTLPLFPVPWYTRVPLWWLWISSIHHSSHL